MKEQQLDFFLPDNSELKFIIYVGSSFSDTRQQMSTVNNCYKEKREKVESGQSSHVLDSEA